MAHTVLLQGIFPAQGLNPCLLHCRQMLYHLSHQGSLNWWTGGHKGQSQKVEMEVGKCRIIYFIYQPPLQCHWVLTSFYQGNLNKEVGSCRVHTLCREVFHIIRMEYMGTCSPPMRKVGVFIFISNGLKYLPILQSLTCLSFASQWQRNINGSPPIY